MRLFRSVVGKLWITILLLVSFVLFILTILLLEFFENYHIDEMKRELTSNANKIANVLESRNEAIGLDVSWGFLDDVTKVVVVKKDKIYYSPDNESSIHLPASYFIKDKSLNNVLEKGKMVQKIADISSKHVKNPDDSKVLIVGVPIQVNDQQSGAVYIYQSLQDMKKTTDKTTKFILLAAGVAIVLTTIFAFFLSTRITLPLRKLREAAFEVARGKFDTKVPILQHDEIGELAIAFNQMGRQLKFNMDALKQEKEQLSSILSSMADGVITFNRDGTILITNPPAELFLQSWVYDQDQNVGTSAVPSEVMELFQSAVDTEKEQIGEVSIQGRFWVIIVSPLYNNKFIRGAVAVIRDMTEDRQLDKLRKDFIANVSHELRTPISMMQGYSEAIVDGIAESEEEKKEMAKVIYEESLRMGRLVNELLDLGRMEVGHIQLSIEKIEIHPFVQRIIRKFQGLAKEKEISINYMMSDQIDYFDFDSDRIEQVFTNLIDNALKHTPTGGRVDVIEKVNEKGLHFEICDSGSGIPEEDLPFIFERFYKADKARTRGSGTGLGLAIAKNIINAHKGSITVHSKLGQGTTFSFFIPRRKA